MLKIHFLPIMVTWMAAGPLQADSVQPKPSPKHGWDRITELYLFSSELPVRTRVGDPGITQDVDSLRMEIARLTGSASESVPLVQVAFDADGRPDVSFDASGDVKYRARFCRYDADGTSHVEVDETFSREGATVFLGRQRGKEKFVLVARDYLADLTVDVIKVQRNSKRPVERTRRRLRR